MLSLWFDSKGGYHIIEDGQENPSKAEFLIRATTMSSLVMFSKGHTAGLKRKNKIVDDLLNGVINRLKKLKYGKEKSD